jgi:hypothetical protein
VYRNFETFIAALGMPSADALDLADSAQYPARLRTDSAVHGLSERMDARLTELHREIYSALLRPREYFRGERRSFPDAFWPDLRHTAFDQLFEALCFYFTRRTLGELTVPGGLNLLRAVFFNHEAAEPALWLSAARERLAPERRELPLHRGRMEAPSTARVEDLAFCIHSGLNRPALSAGWLTGQIVRQFDGRLRIDFECGRDPGLLDDQRHAQHAARLDADAAATLRRVFGWREVRAA